MKDTEFTKISFRCPNALASAMQAAAERGFCSVSTIARLAAAKEMQARGLLKENASGEPVAA
jgi:hypothetical protein